METSVTQRLNAIVDTFEKGVKSSFAHRIGISQQGAHDLLGSRKGGPSFKVLTKILESYPQIRIEWLVLGRGPMIQEETLTLSNVVDEPTASRILEQVKKDHRENEAKLEEKIVSMQTKMDSFMSGIRAAVDKLSKLPDSTIPTEEI
jgi:hypothetical protein